MDLATRMLRYNLVLSADGSPIASGECRAFARRTLTPPETHALEALLPRSSALTGKTALVTGSSRGLGASVARLLALQGCTVIGSYRTNAEHAEAAAASVASASGKLIPTQGDAASLEWCTRTRDELVGQQDGLDFLVLNACPPILAYQLDEASLTRVSAYVAKAFAMASHPLGVFAPMLEKRKGTVVVISSVAVETPVEGWPQYCAAKHAIEGLVSSAALQYRKVSFIVVRPPQLLTDLTNVPFGRTRADAPEAWAARIVQRLLLPARGNGKVDYLGAPAASTSG
jgi:3-oxoacyl-[acyl-carrier protein] reductase